MFIGLVCTLWLSIGFRPCFYQSCHYSFLFPFFSSAGTLSQDSCLPVTRCLGYYDFRSANQQSPHLPKWLFFFSLEQLYDQFNLLVTKGPLPFGHSWGCWNAVLRRQRIRKALRKRAVTAKMLWEDEGRMTCAMYDWKVDIYIRADSWLSPGNCGPGATAAADPGKGWLGEKRCLGNSQRSRPARLSENDCQFGLVSADCVPRREGMAVIKQFSEERYCFQLPRPPVYFMTTLFTRGHARTYTRAHTHVDAHMIIRIIRNLLSTEGMI